MRRVHIDEVEEGAKLAKTIFTLDGRMLLTRGIELRKTFIDKIRNVGITELYIEDQISDGIIISDVVLENTRQEAKQLVKNLMEDFTETTGINAGGVLNIVNKLIDELLSNKEVLINLSDIKSVDDYTFEHSVNVCILSLITGIGLGYDTSRLQDLGTGAILHDIGKLRIPETILKKPSQLTVEEFEEIKKHTIYGYEILKDNKKVSMIAAFIAFGHHERFDGSGYPLQLRGDNIHQCARIVAIADVYDALTSDRVYRKKLRPSEVIEYITSLGSHHFDKEIVESFMSFIAVYPVGSGVLLNTQERAIVVKANKSHPTKPVVRVIYSKDKIKLESFYEIDLIQNPNVVILASCNL